MFVWVLKEAFMQVHVYTGVSKESLAIAGCRVKYERAGNEPSAQSSYMCVVGLRRSSGLQLCYLVYLVHHTKRAAVQLLQGHEVEHGGDTALPTALVVCSQFMELRAAAELHSDTDPIFIIFLLRGTEQRLVYPCLSCRGSTSFCSPVR